MKIQTLALVGLIAGLAQAEPDANQESVAGLGALACAEFDNRYQSDPASTETQYYTWAQGFISAVNTVSIASGKLAYDLGSIDVTTQQQFLRTFCDEHPQAQYLTAVFVLLSRFNPVILPP